MSVLMDSFAHASEQVTVTRAAESVHQTSTPTPGISKDLNFIYDPTLDSASSLEIKVRSIEILHLHWITVVKFTQLCSKFRPTALLNFACDG